MTQGDLQRWRLKAVRGAEVRCRFAATVPSPPSVCPYSVAVHVTVSLQLYADRGGREMAKEKKKRGRGFKRAW